MKIIILGGSREKKHGTRLNSPNKTVLVLVCGVRHPTGFDIELGDTSHVQHVVCTLIPVAFSRVIES